MVEDLINRLRMYKCGSRDSVTGQIDSEAAADLIEQQAARIAELEAAIRKQANAARCLADATIRDASIRQGLAEKAYAESSPEVLASERQANAMLTEENERLTARLTALESERDALLAAAEKEAVPVASDAWEAYLAEQKLIVGMPGLHARPSFIAGFHAAMSAVSTTQATAIYQTRGKLDPDSEWTDHRKKDFDILRDDLFDKRIVYTAPTAALEKGDGRDAEWLAEVCEDADGTKHIEAVVEELDDIPTGTRLYAGTHMAWRPIETAPKDGTWILMTNGVDVAGGQWIRDEGGTTEYRDEDGRYLGQDDRDDFEGWMDWMGGIPSPTHWSPLPAPPAALSQKAGEQQ